MRPLLIKEAVVVVEPSEAVMDTSKLVVGQNVHMRMGDTATGKLRLIPVTPH